MQRLLHILQLLLKCGLLFLIAFIWLRFIFSSIWICGLIAFAITLIIEFSTAILKRKNKNKNSLKLKEKEDAENMFLSLLADKDSLSFFHQLAKSRHQNSEKKKNYVSIKHFENKIIIYPFIKIAKLVPDDILNIYKTCQIENAQKIGVVCNEIDKEGFPFIKNLAVKFLLLDKFETYSMLYKEYEFYPEVTLQYQKDAKPKMKDLIAYSFNKSRTKGYLASALILLIPSLFTKLNIYYCIVSSILLLFALISFINPWYNVKKEQTIL